MTTKELYQKASEITTSLKFKNKYTWAAFHKLINARVFTLNEAFKNQTPLNDFVKSNGSIMIFPTIVNGKMTGSIIRSIENGAILKYKSVNMPYGIGKLRKDFKYGDPIFIVEGIADYAAIKLLGKDIDVVAMQTVEISHALYELYSSVTNNIILIPDNDERGQIAVKRMKYKLKGLGVNVNVINQYGMMKDTGELLELAMMVDRTDSSSLKEELALIASYYRHQINLYRS